MKVQITKIVDGKGLDIPTIKISTGRIYDGNQVVTASCIGHSTDFDLEMENVIFQISDNSRGIYEKVNVILTWGQIKKFQSDNMDGYFSLMLANMIMREYDNSRYYYG